MKYYVFILLNFFIISDVFSQVNKEQIEDIQQKTAFYVFKQIKTDNLDSVYKYVDSKYLNTNKLLLQKSLTEFYNEFKILAPSSKFYFTKIWPKEKMTFQFSYIDSTGLALQVELSFKEMDINSKIISIETKNRSTLKKERERSATLKPSFITDEPQKKYPYTTTLLLKNCNKENRIMTFISPVDFFKLWVYGQYKLEKNKVLNFSPGYKLDSTFLRFNILKLRKSLPKNFWTFPMYGLDRDNEPNEEAISFTELFVQVNKNQHIKIFSAYKITFEGNDARVDANRKNPKIKNIEFIFDTETLQNLEKQINKD